MVNPKLIFLVRSELNNLPEDYVSDEAILQSILKAEAIVDFVAKPDATDDDKERAVLYLAVYYTYLNYLSISNRAFGSIPSFSPEFVESLKQPAIVFLRKISEYEIDDNLNIKIPDRQLVSFGSVGSL